MCVGRISWCPRRALLTWDVSGLTVLCRGGRLPSWHTLVSQWPGNPFAHPASNEHVDLMLEVGEQHGLRGIDGFKLLGPQQLCASPRHPLPSVLHQCPKR